MTLDEQQRIDTDILKARTRNQEVSDFVEALAVWGFNYHNHILLWEAMVSVIEADEKGDFEGLIGDD